MAEASPPISRTRFVTTLIPNSETVSWKIHNVSELQRTKAWTALSIPMEVALGPQEVSRWSISLQARNNGSLLCARAMLIDPKDPNRRVTHLMRVAVMNTGEDGRDCVIHYFPNVDNSNNRNNNPETATPAASLTRNTTNNRNNTNDTDNRCLSFNRIRRLFSKNVKLDNDDQDNELGDGSATKEARPGHKGHPSLWKVAPLDKLTPDEHDCIELRVTLAVYGCDVSEER